MDPVIVLSPHFDDAVLSVGQFIASWPGAYVVTVCAEGPDERQSTTFDERSGFKDSAAAVQARRQEDERALSVLGARSVWMPFLDHQYRKGVALDTGAIVGRVSELIAGTGAVKLLAPVGLGHPDHRDVASAAWRLRHLVDVYAYEELPGRVWWPEEAVDAVMLLRRRYQAETAFLGTADIEDKERAVRCYESQMWAVDWRASLVPERLWRLK